MSTDTKFFTAGNKHRSTQKQKDANDKQWYKDRANQLDIHAFGSDNIIDFGSSDRYRSKKANYDLFNNKINLKDFEYVCKPFGDEVGDLPADLANKDIVSGKIKVLLGMEMKMPFSWKLVAVNEEATTRKEQEELAQIKQFVEAEIMRPIKMQIEHERAEQNKGAKLTDDEKKKLQQQIAQEIQKRTPDEVKKYMNREHQDPAEKLGTQLLQYLIQKEAVRDKFNKGWKHMNLSGTEIYQVGIFNGEPGMRVVNPLRFTYDKSDDLDFIEDSEWARAEFRMSPSKIVEQFGSELTDAQIDRIYEYHSSPRAMADAQFTFMEDTDDSSSLSVRHLVWKSLMKVGFLIYKDRQGKEQMDLVDENYKFNPKAGDIEIQWEWIPEAHETYIILDDIYVYCRPVQGQYKDLDNLWNCKLPYYGASCDGLNSEITSPMDRMKAFQYYYNIILYRIEMLMASDKGKILAMNINGIPKSAGIDLPKVLYFMEANKLLPLNPNEEGNRGAGDITNMVKEIDMSLVSDIMKYINIADYIETKCGAAIGVTKAMEAQIAPGEAVANTRQNIVQSSHIIQPYFELHNIVKGNVLQGLIETAKVAYSISKPKKLSYVLDDMTYRMLNIDTDLLDGTSYGLFMSNSAKAEDAKQAIIGLAQAAMQNQQADLLDVVKIIKSDSIGEAEEQLQLSMQNKAEQMQSGETAKIQADKEAKEDDRNFLRESWKHEDDLVVLKERERRKTEIQKQAMLSMGFDTNKDEDGDGVPDVLEVAKFGVDAEIKRKKIEQDDRKLDLEGEKLEHKKAYDEQKLKIENKKANKPTGNS